MSTYINVNSFVLPLADERICMNKLCKFTDTFAYNLSKKLTEMTDTVGKKGEFYNSNELPSSCKSEDMEHFRNTNDLHFIIT